MSESIELTKLGLHLPTDPRWVDLTKYSLEEILTDHAFCELKAASFCISLIQLYPDYDEIVQQVSPVVTEEWGHFRQVLAELKKRGYKLGFQRKDEYVAELIKFQKRGGTKNDRLLDLLLTCALIEARSCERFRLLSLHLDEEDLRKFYHGFMVSEAGHYRMFLNLAENYFNKDLVRIRWKEFLQHEADIMENLGPRGDRLH
ncbi:MAG: tRNA-(ms[2]io[6]A)-hydroxylase [Saprospiraceae bacterium]|nr:tRNA-(ms[2]io[6]A)-hydroxylase [Saprospiraceae bacterium]MBK9631416.1 tRNA-(ms[2]io[6]A)-hydroxylase [Saprospiraceae bacterium]